MQTQNILEQLHDDHQRILDLLVDAQRGDDDQLYDLIPIIAEELKLHTELEELVFYAFLREATADELSLVEASIEHEAATRLLSELEHAIDPLYARALVHVLGDYVSHHIRFEEEHLFRLLDELGVDLEALGVEFEERRTAMLAAATP